MTPLPGETPAEAVDRHLSRHDLLLVLDNFEHVLDAATLIPSARVLATSREPLRLQAERLFRLEPLALPAAVEQFTALVEARDLDASDQDAAAEICRRVDGLPLAVELAAGRVGLLTVPELATRLRDGLDALGPGARDTPPRQRTLTAMIEWSYALLAPEQQRALCALGVFAGGCTIEAAEQVTQAPLDILDALVDKHLAVARGGRLVLLETVREFALSRLADDSVRRRHAEYYAALAEAADAPLEWTCDLTLHDREASNFRAALRWSIERSEAELALRLVAALRHYWGLRELGAEGERWAAAALALDAPDVADDLRGAALETHAYRLNALGRLEEAETAARASLALRPDAAGQAAGLCALASLRLHVHRVQEAYALAREAEAVSPNERLRVRALEIRAMMAPTLEEALAAGAEAAAARRQAGGPLPAARLLASLAYTALYHDAPATAARLCEEALALTDDPYATALIEGNAGLAALLTGALEDADAAFRREFAAAERDGFVGLRFEALSGLAAIAALRGQDELAARLTGAARVATHERHDPVIEARLEERCFAAARARLGESAWAREEALGAKADPLTLL